jgi:hypothetical protein
VVELGDVFASISKLPSKATRSIELAGKVRTEGTMSTYIVEIKLIWDALTLATLDLDPQRLAPGHALLGG